MSSLFYWKEEMKNTLLTQSLNYFHRMPVPRISPEILCADCRCSDSNRDTYHSHWRSRKLGASTRSDNRVDSWQNDTHTCEIPRRHVWCSIYSYENCDYRATAHLNYCFFFISFNISRSDIIRDCIYTLLISRNELSNSEEYKPIM